MSCLIFDMDGTLIDSMPLWQTVGDRFCRDRGITPGRDLNALFHAMTIPQVADYFKSQFSLSDSRETILKDLSGYAYQSYLEDVPLKPGVMNALRYFKSQDFKMGIATANERLLVDAVLDRLGIRPFFSCIRTCSDVGAAKKESAAVFESCRACLGEQHNQDAVVFEDAPHAIEVAKRAGFVTVGVYDLSYAHDLAHLKAYSDYYCPTANTWRCCLSEGNSTGLSLLN